MPPSTAPTAAPRAARLALALAALLLLAGCWLALAEGAAAATRPLLVHGGTDAPAGDWSWAVALVDPDEPVAADGQFCGGTLVAPTVVVTAAHCLISGRTQRLVPLASVEVVTGAVDLGVPDLEAAGGQRLAVTEMHLHPGYNPALFGHDLAVLKLASPSSSTPARVISDAERAAARPGRQAYVAGWGYTTEPKFASRLQVARVPIQPDWMCALLGSETWDGGAMTCAGGFGAAYSCSGDSGGPLMVRDADGVPILAGVVSFGGPFCQGKFGLSAGFTDLAAYDEWLAGFLPGGGADQDVVEPPDDATAPRVRAFASRGAFGKAMELSVELRDDGGTAQPTVTVFAGRRVLARVTGGMLPAVPGLRFGAPWKAPRLAATRLHFCVTARDRAGNESRPSCAPIRLSARPAVTPGTGAAPPLMLD